MTKNLDSIQVTGIDIRKALLNLKENPNDFDLNLILQTAKDPDAGFNTYTSIETWLKERYL